MKDLIRRLVEIEDKARTITAAEEERLENLDAELAAAKTDKRSELEKRAERRIEKMHTEANEEIKAHLAELNRRNDEETKRLRASFKQNSERWSEEIYREIVAM